VVAVAKRLQSGRLDAYLLYMLIALIAIIAVVTALASALAWEYAPLAGRP